MKRIIGAIAAVTCIAGALTPASASAQTADTWQYQAAIYVYLPTIGGKTSFPVSGSGDVGLDADKILDHLKMTFMGSLEANNGTWGAYTDVFYFNLGNSKSDTRDIAIGGVDLPGSANANVHMDLKATVWSIAGEYRLMTSPEATLDLLGGARLLDLKESMEYEVTGNVGTIPLPGRAGNSSSNLTNWDAIIGVKGRVLLGDEKKWYLPYYADVGAGESKSTWQAMTGVGYRFGWADVVVVWRYIDYKMKSGTSIESLNANGPAVAAVFRW